MCLKTMYAAKSSALLTICTLSISNKADRDCQLAALVNQMSESDRRTFQIYDFLMYSLA